VGLRPGWCRGRTWRCGGTRHPPLLPGKPRASGNRGWRGTQRGALRAQPAARPQSTYLGGTPGLDGWATRKGSLGRTLGAERGKPGASPGHGMEGTHTSMTCAEHAGAEVVVTRQGAEGDWRPCYQGKREGAPTGSRTG
jgi:hypothetical protein